MITGVLGIYNQITWSEWDGLCFGEALLRIISKNDMKLDRPIEYVYTTTHSAKDAYAKVLDHAGSFSET